MKKMICLAVCILIISVTGCAAKEEPQVDYEEYMKKTWVVEDWHGAWSAYHASFYFTITKIEGEFIEGRFGGGNPDTCYTDHWKFMGTISENEAMCRLCKGDEEKGILKIVFLDNGRIEGEINFTPWEISHKKYIFRPYTLNDEKYLRLTPLYLRDVIDTWGEVTIVTGVLDDPMNKPIPAVYIIDESDAILYSFEAGYQVASEVYEIKIEDYDGDGLDDVKIVTYFSYEPDSIFIERIFYQAENGFFYYQW